MVKENGGLIRNKGNILSISTDDLDILINEHGNVFPEDWDAGDIMNLCCRYANSNIEDIKEFFDFS